MKKANNSKKYVIIFSAFIVFSMIVSIFAILVNNPDQNSLQYGKQAFTMTNTGYRTKIDGKMFDFTYYPSELERVNMSDDIYSLFNNAQGIVLIFDPNDTVDNLAYIDSARFELQAQMPKTMAFGITQNSTNYYMPVISCANATAEVPFILINSSITTSFETGPNPYCIIMNGKLKELIAAKDRLVYRMYGIMTQ